MTDAMTHAHHDLHTGNGAPAPRPRPTPPPVTTTAYVLCRGHLTWLGWTWVVTAMVFTVLMAMIVRFDGHLDASLWQGAGASWQRYVIFAAGVTTMPSFLAMFVANGITRAQLAASSTIAMAAVALAGATFVIGGFVAEAVVFDATGWSQVLDSGEPVSSGPDLVVLGLRYALLFCMWFTAGWLIGTGFYRYGFVRGVALIVPFAIPVLVCELVVGRSAASINVDAFTGLMNVPLALGLLLAVGLIVMNATIARAFTRSTAVRAC